MVISAKKRKGVAILHINADMTIRNASELRKELIKHLTRPCECEIDLSDVKAMDTTGVQLLMQAKREANRHCTPLRLVGHSKAAYEAIDTYNLAAYFGDPLWISGQESA